MTAAQRPTLRSRCSGYRAPCTVICEAALSISRRSSGVSSTSAAPMFSSSRCSFVVPGIGTAASLGLSAVATIGFLEGTALYAASLAELHGIRLTDPDRARTMVMAIMLGEEGTELLGALSGQSLGKGKGITQAWGRTITKDLPGGGFGLIRGAIQRAFLKRLVQRQGAALLGRALPFGVGAVVGGVGNRIMGRAVAASAREAFGPMPDIIPGELLPAVRQNALEGGNSGSQR